METDQFRHSLVRHPVEVSLELLHRRSGLVDVLVQEYQCALANGPGWRSIPCGQAKLAANPDPVSEVRCRDKVVQCKLPYIDRSLDQEIVNFTELVIRCLGQLQSLPADAEAFDPLFVSLGVDSVAASCIV